jgi:hypothetical protein
LTIKFSARRRSNRADPQEAYYWRGGLDDVHGPGSNRDGTGVYDGPAQQGGFGVSMAGKRIADGGVAVHHGLAK